MAQRHDRDLESLAHVVFHRQHAYAKKAHDILLAWATTQTSFTGSESMLDLGDYAYTFVGGADILRGTWPGWTAADTTAVKSLFRQRPSARHQPVWRKPVRRREQRRAGPLSPADCWRSSTTTPRRSNRIVYQVRTLAHIGLRSSNDIGMLGDSLRDQGHAHGQLLSLAMLAEALWKQGIDIYSDYDNRLLAAGEYFARVNDLAVPRRFSPSAPPMPITSPTSPIAAGEAETWRSAILHGAYVVRKGLPAPYITRRLQSMPVDGGSFMFLKETDTSMAKPAPALSFPKTTAITSGFTDVEIGGASPTGNSSYSGGTWTVQGGGTDIWGANDSCHFTYKAITGDGAIIAKVESVQNTNQAARAGVMMRTSLDQGAPRAWMAVTPSIRFEQNMPGPRRVWRQQLRQ